MEHCSAKIWWNPQRINQDGRVRLYLRVIVNRRKKDIDLKIKWPLDRFCQRSGKCLPISKDDPTANDVNMILSDAMAKASDIFVTYRLRHAKITLEAFLTEFLTNGRRDSFLDFYAHKARQRYRDGDITESSYKNHLATLAKLKEWRPNLLFSEMDSRTAYQFETFLKRRTPAKTTNARWVHHKNFKTYVNQALKGEQREFINPYAYFSAKSEMGRHRPLTKEDFLKVWEMYQLPTLPSRYRIAIRGFLFSCVTGMRHGDVRRVDLTWIDGDFFDFVPKKTERWGTRVRMPVTKEALNLIADDIDEVGGFPLFCGISEQKDNVYIREVGADIGLKMNLCYQVARETFATLYMEHDGKLEVLAAFMGHTSTKMSEKYVKIMELRRKQEALRISRFFNQ